MRHRERALLAEAVAGVAVARLLLRVLPFGAARGLLGRDEAPRVADGDLVDRVATAVAAAGRRFGPGPPACLAEALAGRAMLWRRGVPSRVRIGVMQAPRQAPRDPGDLGDRLRVHAWLEAGGRPVLGGGLEPGGYAALGE